MAALDAPTGLKVAVLSDDSVQLAWDTGDSGATFNILRAASATGPFVMIASGITGSTWTDSGLVKAKPYYYHITANNLSGTSTASGSVRVIPHPLFCRSSLYATADAYVDRGYPTSNTGAATQITVKHASSTTIQRKGYVRFDLGGQTPAPAANATLRFVASTWNEPSTWQVYGLKDGDAGESWGESTLTWYNAPANYTTTGNTLDTGRTTYLGSISPAAGPSVGAMLELRSAALDAFLAADANKTVTFILIRSNSSDSANTSIASRENTAYGVPTLSFDRVVTDSDGDGFEDAFELLHGSDPVSPSSVPLRITSHGFSDPQQAYGVTASGFSPAWTYVLKRSTNLVDGFPVTIGDPVYSTGDPVTVYDASPPDGRAVFYRFESAP
jgi:hypothetical protein